MWKEWGSEKIAQITGTKPNIPVTATGLPPRRSASPYNMQVMELDLVVVNDLGVEVKLARQSYADYTRVPQSDPAWHSTRLPEPTEFTLRSSKNMHSGYETTQDVATADGSTSQKVVTRDGEVWKATFQDPETKATATIKITADFRWGIFQEVWLSELRSGRESRNGRKFGITRSFEELPSQEELMAMKVKDIKQLLDDMGLDTKGKKSALVHRLLHAK